MTRNDEELEFQENFEEKEETTSISCERADADQSEGNNCSQEEIESFIKEQKSENTVRKTASDMKTFNRYLSSINKNIQVLDLPAADLDRILSKFFKLMSVKSMAKNMKLTRYQAFSEAYIQRFLSDGKSHFNVLIDKEFETSRKVLAAKRKSLLQKAGKGNRPNTTRSLMKKTNFLKVANSVLPVLKSFREPCGGFCLSTLVLGPGMKAASCFGATYNYNKILFKIAAKFLSVREIV